MEWEQIDSYHQRTKVFGGWLVRAYEDVYEKNLDGIYSGEYNWRLVICLVPDPNHEWKIGESNE